MELSISREDAAAILIGSQAKQRIVGLVHQHLGLASVVTVKMVESTPPGVSLETASGNIVVDRDFTKRIDL